MELMILFIVPFQLALWRIRTGSSAFQFPSQTPVGWPLGEKWVEPKALQSTCFRRQLQGHRVFMWPAPHKSQEKKKNKRKDKCEIHVLMGEKNWSRKKSSLGGHRVITD